jgi:hypothetical protein
VEDRNGQCIRAIQLATVAIVSSQKAACSFLAGSKIAGRI